jgi:hypothetical protein
MPRPAPLGFAWGTAHAIVDNDWKLMNKPIAGQCDYQVTRVPGDQRERNRR